MRTSTLLHGRRSSQPCTAFRHSLEWQGATMLDKWTLLSVIVPLKYNPLQCGFCRQRESNLRKSGIQIMNLQNEYQWVERFKAERTRVTDKWRSVCPSIARKDDGRPNKHVLQTWVREQRKRFFSDGMKKLVGRYQKCIAVRGVYFKK